MRGGFLAYRGYPMGSIAASGRNDHTISMTVRGTVSKNDEDAKRGLTIDHKSLQGSFDLMLERFDKKRRKTYT